MAQENKQNSRTAEHLTFKLDQFEGPDMQMGDIKITEAYVNDKIGSIVEDKDLSQYIL